MTRLLPLVVLLALGCSSASAPVAAVPRAPVAVSELRIALQPQGGTPDDVTRAVEVALLQAGYQASALRPGYGVGPESFDLIGRLQVLRRRAELLPGVVITAGAGSFHYDLTLQLVDPSSVIGVYTTSFEASAGQTQPADVAAVPAAMNTSPGLIAFAEQLNQQREQALAQRSENERRRREAIEKAREDQARLQQERADAAQRAEADAARRADEEAWIRADGDACRRASSLDACKKVQFYLVRFPEGAHASEGRDLLEQAKPKLKALEKEESAWAAADPRSCETEPSATTCISVCSHLGQYPMGGHAADARALLRAASMDPAKCL